MRQKHDAEMIRLRPVEAGALHQHDPGLLQQLQEELLVVLDRVHLRVEFRKHVERGGRLDAGHAGDRGDEFVGQVALAAQAAAFAGQVVDALVAAQCRLNRILPRHVGTQAHVREHVEALDVVLRRFLVARDHHPARAIAAGAVAFGERIEGQREHVVAETADRRVAGIVVQDLVVDLVGKNHESVLARDQHDGLEQFVRIQGTGRVVGVDDHDALGARRDPGPDIVEVGHPAVGLVAAVVHRRAARQTGRSCPQRVVGRRQEQLVAVVQQRIGCHHDQFAGAVAQVDVIERNPFDTLLLGVMHHGLARGEDTLAVGIARRIRQVADHVLLDFLGAVEAKHGEIADVELDDLVALLLHLPGGVHDGAPDVVADVGELGRFENGFQSPSGNRYSEAKPII